MASDRTTRPGGDELQRTRASEPGRPIHRELDNAAQRQSLVGGEQDAPTAKVQQFSVFPVPLVFWVLPKKPKFLKSIQAGSCSSPKNPNTWMQRHWFAAVAIRICTLGLASQAGKVCAESSIASAESAPQWSFQSHSSCRLLLMFRFFVSRLRGFVCLTRVIEGGRRVLLA